MTNSTVISDKTRMYQNINWAIRKNAQGNQTDLKGDYFDEMQTLDDSDGWGVIETFYESLLSGQGFEYTHDKYYITIDQFPCITKFLTVCVYS